MREPARVDNAVYHRLGERWYEASDDPIALLRAEARVKNPWVERSIDEALGAAALGSLKVLDIGCGAGFLSNALSDRRATWEVHGLDASAASLEVARRHDSSGRVQYVEGDAYGLPYPDASFDVACAMDFLEHVEDPSRVIREAARILRPGGLFFFHTFNRTPLARLVVIHATALFVPNTPRNLHLYRLFIKPRELAAYCGEAGLEVEAQLGIEPDLFTRHTWELLARRRVNPEFPFRITRRLWAGYIGYARRG